MQATTAFRALIETPGTTHLCEARNALSADVGGLLHARVAESEPGRVVYSTGNWLDVDSLDDLVPGGSV